MTSHRIYPWLWIVLVLTCLAVGITLGVLDWTQWVQPPITRAAIAWVREYAPEQEFFYHLWFRWGPFNTLVLLLLLLRSRYVSSLPTAEGDENPVGNAP